MLMKKIAIAVSVVFAFGFLTAAQADYDHYDHYHRHHHHHHHCTRVVYRTVCHGHREFRRCYRVRYVKRVC